MCDEYLTTSLWLRRANGEIDALFQEIPPLDLDSVSSVRSSHSYFRSNISRTRFYWSLHGYVSLVQPWIQKAQRSCLIHFYIPSTERESSWSSVGVCWISWLIHGFSLRSSSLGTLQIWKFLGNFRFVIKWPQLSLQRFPAERFKGNIACNLCKTQM